MTGTKSKHHHSFDYAKSHNEDGDDGGDEDVDEDDDEESHHGRSPSGTRWAESAAMIDLRRFLRRNSSSSPASPSATLPSMITMMTIMMMTVTMTTTVGEAYAFMFHFLLKQ